jgi:hypothetical protein
MTSEIKSRAVSTHREPQRPLFAAINAAYLNEMSGSKACAITPFGRTVDIKFRPVS